MALLVDLHRVVGGSVPLHGSGATVQRATLYHESAVPGTSREPAAEARAFSGMQGPCRVGTGGESKTTNVPGRDAETWINRMGADESAESRGAWWTRGSGAEPGPWAATEEIGTFAPIEAERRSGTTGCASKAG